MPFYLTRFSYTPEHGLGSLATQRIAVRQRGSTSNPSAASCLASGTRSATTTPITFGRRRTTFRWPPSPWQSVRRRAEFASDNSVGHRRGDAGGARKGAVDQCAPPGG